jgi:Sulfotransferase family
VRSNFRLLMISAMYENGGNTTQRFLDGHPDLYSYPFESQLGSKHVVDHLSSMFPVKYRWPVFPLSGTAESDYETIIDEECKVRLKTPQSSKFRDYPIALDDRSRKALFLEHMRGKERTRANLIEAFFRASAGAWEDRNGSGRESVHVGYSPIVVVDADKIVADLPGAHVLQIVRNPWSAYADTKKRAVPLSIAHYMTAWCLNQQAALTFAALNPGRIHVVRFEDVVADPMGTLGGFLGRLGVAPSPELASPSWNGRTMEQVYPWGTVRTPTPEANRATAAELSEEETEEITLRTRPLLATFGYDTFLSWDRRAA